MVKKCFQSVPVRLRGRRTRLKRVDGFMLGMILAVVLAFLFPSPGASGGWIHPELLTKLGVALVFFLHGLTLSFAAMKSGILRWQVHLVVQGATFLLFPLIGLLALHFTGSHIPADIATGFFFLCALPSTVSSSVAMTAVARGNVAAAVFNATLSSLLGIILTPLWIGLVHQHSGQDFPMGKVMLDLLTWLMLPLLLGQVLHPFLGQWALSHKQIIHKIDRGTILLLVYTSFCDSVKWNVWTGYGAGFILAVSAAVIALFLTALAIMQTVCRMLGFPLPDKAAAVFCGSKKSLAQGVPMAQLMFAGSSGGLGMILLPIMIYHPLQLFICGFIARNWARKGE